eukprot:1778134-Prorocentrum_lima.AAC.1
MEMDMLMEGAEERDNVRRDKGAREKGAPLREFVGEEMDGSRREPLRSELRAKLLQREGAAEKEGTRSVGEGGGDVHKEEPPGVGAQVAAVDPDTGGEQRLCRAC